MHNEPSRFRAQRLFLSRVTRDALRLFEIASVVVRFSVAASFVGKANHSIVRAADPTPLTLCCFL